MLYQNVFKFHLILGSCNYNIELSKSKSDFSFIVLNKLTIKNRYNMEIGSKKLNQRTMNNILNIEKLKDGLIKKYQVHNVLELEIIKKYLMDNNILFRIGILYNNNQFAHGKICRNNNYLQIDYKTIPEHNKLFNTYIVVYKGFVDLTGKNQYNENIINRKYKIYLY